MQLRDKYLWLIGVLLIAFVSLSLIAWSFFGAVTLVFDIAIAMALILAVQFESYFRFQEDFNKLIREQLQKQADNYKQTEALFSIFSLIKFQYPLPPMRRWAISPDFAKLIIELVLEKKPKLVMEASSGISTLMVAYCLKQLGGGQVISLEHEEKYAAISRNNLIKHGLQDYATVVYAPLKEITLNGKSWLWYDTAQIPDVQNIDLLIVDGPTQHGQKREMTRYPAMPVLFKSLNPNTTVLLDDANRKDEKKLIKLWLEQFSGFIHEYIETEKGAVILERSPTPPVSETSMLAEESLKY